MSSSAHVSYTFSTLLLHVSVKKLSILHTIGAQEADSEIDKCKKSGCGCGHAVCAIWQCCCFRWRPLADADAQVSVVPGTGVLGLLQRCHVALAGCTCSPGRLTSEVTCGPAEAARLSICVNGSNHFLSWHILMRLLDQTGCLEELCPSSKERTSLAVRCSIHRQGWA